MLRSFFSALALALACAPAPPPEPCTGPAPTKGPWVTRMTATSVRIAWEAREPGCAEVSLAPEGDAAATPRIAAGAFTPFEVTAGYGEDILPDGDEDATGTFYMAAVDATSLQAGTCYAYRLRTAAGDVPARFCAARPPGQATTFLAIGDTNPVLGRTKDVLVQVLPSNPDFSLHLGDVQYYASVIETWTIWAREMAPLLRAGAFLPAIGNHEYEDALGDQEFAQYYARFFPEPGADGTTDWYHFASGGLDFFSLNTELALETGSPQVEWVSGALATAAARQGHVLSIVYMHRPLYSLSNYEPNKPRRAVLEPLFKAHKVPLVLAGHVHAYERFEVDGITHVVSGGGGGRLSDVDARAADAEAPLRKAAAQRYHAVLLDFDGATVRGRAIDKDGAEFDTFTVTAP